MQKNVNNIYTKVFTLDFIQKMKEVLKRVYGYETYMDFVIVPTLPFGKTLVYIPILSYSDRTHNEIEDLLELSKENEYQIRVLNFDYKEFKKNDTVTMRIDIENRSCEEIFMEDLKSKHRKVIKKALKNESFTFVYGNDKKLIDDFYKIFTSIMYMHGTPPLGKGIFTTLADVFKENVVLYNVYDNDNIIASYCVLIDKEIAYGSWGGMDERYRDKLVGHYAYWNIIHEICSNRALKVFDFGRSAYDSGGYTFKHRFGAKPVKIDIISSNQDDIYSKYSLASSIWKKMPKSFTDALGPKLCKYLVDL